MAIVCHVQYMCGADNHPLKSSLSCYSLYPSGLFYMYSGVENLMKTDNCLSVYVSSNCFQRGQLICMYLRKIV